MPYVYMYKLETPTGLLIKIGHGKTYPKNRMEDYTKTHNLTTIPNSLIYQKVNNSANIEEYLHEQFKNKGFRNINDSHIGMQEVFQAPHRMSYKQTKRLFHSLLKENRQYSPDFFTTSYSLTKHKYQKYHKYFDIPIMLLSFILLILIFIYSTGDNLISQLLLISPLVFYSTRNVVKNVNSNRA